MSTQRWERRERKKQSERERMPKSGMSVRLIHQIIGQRAAEAQAKAAKEEKQILDKGSRKRVKPNRRR